MSYAMYSKLEKTFERLHNNPPKPFNPDFDPKARARGNQVAREMEAEGFYKTHTREECKQEYARRYDELKAKGL